MNEKLECVKCGKINPFGSPACIKCSWPFSPEAWKSTSHKIESITIDTGCINVKQMNNNLNKLEAWASEKKIIITRSHTMMKELTGKDRKNKAVSVNEHPEVWSLGSATSKLGINTNIAGPDMTEPLKRIMFPTTQIVNVNQAYDIEHLQSHLHSGGDVFVTLNPQDFILRGKKEKLSSLGIWAFNPDELVDFLNTLYGWH